MKVNNLRFTVILTLYNKEPYIERTLRSILSQSKKPSEIIIIDDVSTDNSLTLARDILTKEADLCSETTIKIIEHQQNGGPSVARNTALREVTGDYVFLLDADDEYHPGFFERAEYIFNQYDASILFYQFERDPGGRVLPFVEGLNDVTNQLEPNIYELPNLIKAFGHNHFGMNGSSVACKHSALVGCFYKENLNCFEGLEFWYRIARRVEAQNGKGILLSGIQVTIHLTKDSVSRKLVNNGGEIYIPAQFDLFRLSRNIDEQRLRKRIYTIWVRNAFLKMPNIMQRGHFLWKYRRQIIENSLQNLFFYLLVLFKK